MTARRLAFDRNGLSAFDRVWLEARDAREAQDAADWTQRELERAADQLRADLDTAEEITLETRAGVVYATRRLGADVTEIALEPTGAHRSTVDTGVLRRLARGAS